MARILIAEPLAEAGVDLLRRDHQVDAPAAMTREELLEAVAGADALVVRSATRVDAEVLEAGRNLRVVGLGRVGTLVAQRMLAFGMRLIAYDPYVSRERAAQLGVELGSLAEVLARADIVTIHLPKTPETVGLLGERELAAVKPGARLVNTARGGIVDETALAKAVESGHLAGAALDVFAEEPTTSSPLFGLDNVVVTPHLGASTA